MVENKPASASNLIKHVNIEQLVHLKAYQSGYLAFDKYFASVPGYIYGQRRVQQKYEHTSSILPFRLTQNSIEYRPNEEFKDIPRPYVEGFVPRPHDDGSAYDAKAEQTKEQIIEYLAQKTEPIEVGSVEFTRKPVAVIYNPASGRGTNIRDRILTKLTEHGVEARFFETERYMHAWEIVCNEINFDEHSALVAVGGDGTLHEVINGMLFRADKKKLPVSFIPHGTGNDLVGCLGTKDVEQALNWLAKGDTIKMDVNKVLIDVEDEADISETEERHSKIRYSVINSGVGLIAKITHSAVYHKPYMGKLCYFTSGCTNAFTSTVDYYDIIIGQPDGSEIELHNEATMYLLVMNGKLGGGRMLLSPHALLNDGLLDITMQHGPAGKREVLKYIKNCVVQKGMMIYKENYACFRGKWVKIVNRNMATEPATSSFDSDHLGIEEADR